jgi:hypothetical protein
LRTTASKSLHNTATKKLKELLHVNKNDCIQTFLQGLTPTESTDYSLQKVTEKIKHVEKPFPPLLTSQGTGARSNVRKAHAFTKHLRDVFQLHPLENDPSEEKIANRKCRSSRSHQQSKS